MSSRNGYLSVSERALAPALYPRPALGGPGARLRTGDCGGGGRGGRGHRGGGLRPDYVSVRRAEDLGTPGDGDRELVILAAAYLGRARLIDNLRAIRESP